ncbi:hypothetical protein [Saccharothrix syringae]|uniref:Uncharacterized protein n=1 Tax=Saccharothrix syringae TaxID=103733 RepID=A0A5Q0GXC0_SACSY|nr:hypothetical protein EKG83_15810 [Saccharothrix syringae]
MARRLLESDERDRAYDEVREIENLTRRALGDVRTTVSGYRDMSLSAEIVGARAALRAAGVRADLPRVFEFVLRVADPAPAAESPATGRSTRRRPRRGPGAG